MKKQIEKSVKFIQIFSFLALTPFLVHAEVACTGLVGVLCKISTLLGAILPVLVGLGVVYFAWGVVTYFIGSDEEAKKKGRDRIIFGIIGLAVIISVWGLVYLLTDTFGLSTNGSDFKGVPDNLNELLPSSNSQGRDLRGGDFGFPGDGSGFSPGS